MTLVIGLVSRTFAIQVGDRLLTSGDNSFRDPLANKSVVILGHDGFACISYSGVAYIGKRPGKRIPTDQWLAEIAFGRSTTPEPMLPGDVPPVAMFDSSFVPSLGQALERIRTAFSTDLQPNVHKDDRDKFGLQLLVSGFVGRPTPDGKNMRPILSRMLYDENHPLRFKEDTAPRHWEKGTNFSFRKIGQGAPTLLSELWETLDHQTDLRELIASAIREFTKSNATVGPHCLSVVLGHRRHVEITFLPDPDDDTGLAAYTPYVLGPGGILLPQELSGGLPSFQLGGYIINYSRIPTFEPTQSSSITGLARPQP